MSEDFATIKAAVDGAVAYLAEHPEEAAYTDSLATARVVDGLRVRVEDPNGYAVETDMPTSVGGTDTAPSPGWLFRAAIASCVAMMVRLRAAQTETDTGEITVEVDSASNDHGILGIDPAVPAGPLSIEVRVHTTNPAEEVVRWAFDHCPVSEAAGRAVPVSLVVSAN